MRGKIIFINYNVPASNSIESLYDQIHYEFDTKINYN